MAYLPFPSGTLLTFAGPTAPDGWLLCDGSAISRTAYARLFAAISTTYGNGDGASTFNLPDFRGVYPRGAGTNGTANYGGVTGHTPAAGVLATKGGQKTAKNGLTASAGTVSTSVSGAKNQMNGTSGGQSADHAHGDNGHAHATGQDLAFSRGNSIPGSSSGTGGYAHHGLHNGTNTGYAILGGVNANHSHSWDFGGTTFSASGTTPAQTVTINTGDSETTPAFLAINYIIKL